MKILAPGALAVMNAKARSLGGHPGWIEPGRRCRISQTVFLNKRKRKCWYLVDLLGICKNVVGQVKVPSNWLDPL
jgi:hypothetical protein